MPVRAVEPLFARYREYRLELVDIEPVHVAAYVGRHPGSPPTVKQHLAAARALFDWLVTDQVLAMYPVCGSKHASSSGKTPVLDADQARRLLDSIDTAKLSGRRDRALIAVMVFSFARVFTPDEMLDNIMLYWLPNAAASSARLYWESLDAVAVTEPIHLPAGLCVFPKEMARSSRRWAERRFTAVTRWGEPDRGGHFAAFEQPGLFVDEVRAGLRPVR